MLTLFVSDVLQAFKPWAHVCSNLLSPGRPHLPCQDPPLPQQLGPDLLGPQMHAVKQITFRYVLLEENINEFSFLI